MLGFNYVIFYVQIGLTRGAWFPILRSGIFPYKCDLYQPRGSMPFNNPRNCGFPKAPHLAVQTEYTFYCVNLDYAKANGTTSILLYFYSLN